MITAKTVLLHLAAYATLAIAAVVAGDALGFILATLVTA